MTKYLITEDQAHNTALDFIGIAKVKVSLVPNAGAKTESTESHSLDIIYSLRP